MCGEGAFVMEFPVAIFTLKWIVSGVLSRVIIVRLRVHKGGITVFALVWSFTCMLPATENGCNGHKKICVHQQNLPNMCFVWLQLKEVLAALVTMNESSVFLRLGYL